MGVLSRGRLWVVSLVGCGGKRLWGFGVFDGFWVGLGEWLKVGICALLAQ